MSFVEMSIYCVPLSEGPLSEVPLYVCVNGLQVPEMQTSL